MNFTFLINKEEYDLDRQLQVIIGAMEILGLKAEKSGRNDILIDGSVCMKSGFSASDHAIASLIFPDSTAN